MKTQIIRQKTIADRVSVISLLDVSEKKRWLLNDTRLNISKKVLLAYGHAWKTVHHNEPDTLRKPDILSCKITKNAVKIYTFIFDDEELGFMNIRLQIY